MLRVDQTGEMASERVRTHSAAICDGCGEPFHPTRPWHRTCSAACRKLAYRQQAAQRRTAVLERLLPDDPGRAE